MRGLLAGLLLVLVAQTTAGHPDHAHGERTPDASPRAIWDQATAVSDFNYLSLIEGTAGGRAGRACSRLVLADGSLQASEERSDGVLLRLATTGPRVASALLALSWEPSGHARGNGRGDRPGDTAAPGDARAPAPISDFTPAFAFVARAAGGRLVTFVSTRRGGDAIGRHRAAFVRRFDEALVGSEPTAARPGLYVQAVPYLGTAPPDLTVAEPAGLLHDLVASPFSFRRVGESGTVAILGARPEPLGDAARPSPGGDGIEVRVGAPVLVRAAGLMYAVNAYSLR